MKKIFINLNILCLSVSLVTNTMFRNNSEIQAEACARKSRVQKTNGFQGCRNKAQCGFEGFYLASYSIEGLCSECELEVHPERFGACISCRCPQKTLLSPYYGLCFDCSIEVSRSLQEAVKLDDSAEFNLPYNNMLGIAVYQYLRQIKQLLTRKNIPCLKNLTTYNRVFLKSCEDSSKRPMKIYAGSKMLPDGKRLHVWLQGLIIDPQDKKRVYSLEEAIAYISAIADKYNIFGVETGTLLESVPSNALTCEEVVQQ